MNTYTLNDRHAIILENLVNGFVSVTDIAKLTNVSEITIRRDMAEMEKQGLLKRVHGGARSINGRTTVVPFALRQTRNQPQKRRIAKYAESMICDGECVALDTGSTILHMTDYMEGYNLLTVLTTSIYNAARLMTNPNIRIVLPGGILEGQEGALKGELATRSLQDFFVDKFFLCVGAIDAAAGLTEHEPEDAQIKSIIISRTKENILVLDSSKFNTTAFKKVCHFDVISKMVTDKAPEGALLDAVKNAGVEIHVVAEDGSVKII